MTTYKTPYQIEKALDDFIVDNWETPETTNVRWPAEDKPALPYIEPHFKPGQVLGLEIGGAAQRPGVLIINIFTRMNVSNKEGWAYAGKLEQLFWHEQIGNIICENGDLMPWTEGPAIDEALQAKKFTTKIPFTVIWEY